MTISANYSSPVLVNGYSCKNCTDVDNAKKHIDPAHPRSGPYDINAKDDPTRARSSAVMFAGNLNNLNMTQAAGDAARPAGVNYSANATSVPFNLVSARQIDISA